MKLYSRLINYHHELHPPDRTRPINYIPYQGTWLEWHKECKVVQFWDEPEIGRRFKQRYPDYRSPNPNHLYVNLLTQMPNSVFRKHVGIGAYR